MDTTVKRNAYSYIRFSTPEQAKGDSFRRQLTRTQEFCEKHHLLLNETRYEDLGVSGWTGKNMDGGALGDFQIAIKAGKIKPGSVLVVENFDRFSRLKPRIAYAKLGEIIEAGVDVVTLEDGKFHTRETLDDFATLISSLAVMQRANEESTRKSSMISASWANKRKLAAEGKGQFTKKCPLWLRPKASGEGFEVIPERGRIVKRIFKLSKEGKGKREIMRTLNLEKVPVWGRARWWHENYIFLMLRSRTVLGEMQPTHKRKPIGQPIKNYYPALIDEASWLAIQQKRGKHKAGPATGVNNLFSGLLFDGYQPDHPMLFINTNCKKGYCYLQSELARVEPSDWNKKGLKRKGGTRPFATRTIRYPEFEQHLLQNFQDIDFDEIMPEKPSAEASRLAQLEADKKENDKALTNLIKALEGGQQSALVMEQIEKRETTAKKLAKQIDDESIRLKHERHAVDSFEEEQQRLSELMSAATLPDRQALRALFHRIIERIDIFMAGLLEVPEDLKTTVYPDRNGMMCYRITVVGSYKMWIWWDGCQVWENP